MTEKRPRLLSGDGESPLLSVNICRLFLSKAWFQFVTLKEEYFFNTLQIETVNFQVLHNFLH